VFSGERARIRRELAVRGREPTPADALEQIRGEELQLRQLLFNVVGNVLPPRLRAEYFPGLLDTFRAIEHHVYGDRRQRATTAAEEFPVRDLPNNGRLLPHIETLTIEATGWSQNEVESFRDRLVAELGREGYLPDGPGGPAPVTAAAG
jgi:hypothetical protein